jgi:uncharacterized protein
MTRQERQLIDDLFDRLSKLENSPRDPDAQGAIAQGLRTAPNAVYALVQTVLVQDEALKRAHERIQELEGGAPEQRQSGGFLDSMRDAIFGQDQRQGSQGQGSQGSVPNVRAPDMGGRPVWNSGQVMQQAQPPGYGQQYGGGYGQPAGYGAQQPPPMPGGGGGSFLGTAAAAAAGVVGGSLLLGSIRSMMGGGHQQSFGDTASHSGGIEDRRPDRSDSDLAREAGINDIGSSGGRGGDDNSGSRAGLFDQASNEDYADDDEHDSDGFDDDGGGDGGDSDYA